MNDDQIRPAHGAPRADIEERRELPLLLRLHRRTSSLLAVAASLLTAVGAASALLISDDRFQFGTLVSVALILGGLVGYFYSWWRVKMIQRLATSTLQRARSQVKFMESLRLHSAERVAAEIERARPGADRAERRQPMFDFEPHGTASERPS